MVKYNVVFYTCPTCGNTKAQENGSTPRECHLCKQTICKECGIDYICESCGEQYPDLQSKYKVVRILRILFLSLIFVGMGGGFLLMMLSTRIGMIVFFVGGGFILVSAIYSAIVPKLYTKITEKYREKHNIPKPKIKLRYF